MSHSKHLACAIALLIFAVSLPLRAQERAVLDLPSQPLAESLKALGLQTRINVIVNPVLIDGRRAPAVRDPLTTTDALKRLLADTELEYYFVNEQTVVIRQRTSPKATAAASDRGIRFAQAEQPDSPDFRSASPSGAEAAMGSENRAGTVQKRVVELEEIVVTGTHIRGTEPIGSQLLVIDRAQIEATGYATVQDVLQTLPQNFGGTLAELQGGSGNFSRGTGINLRGLGLGTTLTLVNGRRVPLSGDNADYVDVSSIPTSAIERIEVLTDGASAIYGSDAIGGVVNVILKDRYDGAETQLRYASARGDSNEKLLSQTLGKSSERGHVLAGYQFYERSPLPIASRSYAESADKTPFGGSDFRSIFSNPGNIFGSGGALGIPTGQDGTDLRPGDLIPGGLNQGELAEGTDLLQRSKAQSGFFSAGWRLSQTLELFADGRYGVRDFRSRGNAFTTFLFVPASNAFYVDAFGTGEPLGIAYSFFDDLGPVVAAGDARTWTATGGAHYRLPADWTLTGSASTGAERTRWNVSNLVDLDELALALEDGAALTAFNPFADGSSTAPATLERIRSTLTGESRARVWTANVTTAGSPFDVPAGEAHLALGVDYRKESLDSSRSSTLDRDVSAVFGELVVPLWAAATDSATPRLSASAAGRYEDYSDFGRTFNPKLGLQFAPLSALQLRGTWGKSFRAPRLIDLDETALDGRPNVFILPGAFPQPDGSLVAGILRSGNNNDLKEETARSWTAGFDLQPVSLSQNLSVSLTYYSIRYRDRIVSPGPLLITDILLQEDQWAPIISRDPAAIAAACAELTDGDCAATPPAVLVEGQLRNISGVETKGLDFSINDRFDLALGSLSVALSGARVLTYDQQVTPVAPRNDLLDTVFNPLALRIRALADWSWGAWGTVLAVNYTGSYSDNLSVPERRVGSWTTVDAGVSWHASAERGFLGGTELAVRAVNLFDRDPPFVNVGLGIDPANATPLGRLLSATLTRRW